jgi:hypothetical protein
MIARLFFTIHGFTMCNISLQNVMVLFYFLLSFVKKSSQNFWCTRFPSNELFSDYMLSQYFQLHWTVIPSL